MIYKQYEFDIADSSFSEGAAIIALADGRTLIIPEEDATQEESEIIQQIKEDIGNRV